MVLLLKEDIPVTLLSMKGKFSFMLLHTLPLVSFTYKIQSYGMGPIPPLLKLIVSAECMKLSLTFA